MVRPVMADAEIKRAQVIPGDYPVYTTKAATDLSYLAQAQQLFGMLDRIYLSSRRTMRTLAVKQLALNVEWF